MLNPLAQLFQAQADLPTLGARKGEFVLVPPSGNICIMHEAPRASLSLVDASALRAIVPQRNRVNGN